MKRDCACPRAKHEHGTRGAYLRDRCRCLPCRLANHRALAAYRADEPWHESEWASHIGVTRRLRALMALGWSAREVGQRAGLSDVYVQNLRNDQGHPRLRTDTHAAVVKAYGELSGRRNDTAGGRRLSTRARKLGYEPPIAWDDDTIDDPNAKPYASAPVDIDEIAVEQACNGRRVHLTRAERLAAVARLTERGYSEKQISELLGYPARTVARDKAAIRGQDAA